MLLAYVLVLLVSAVLMSISAIRGSGQRTGTRVLNGVLAGIFLCYAIYLALFFAGGTIYIAYWAFILPVVAVVRTIRAHRASKSVTRYEYPDIYAPPAQQWGGAAYGNPFPGSGAAQQMPAGPWGPAPSMSPAIGAWQPGPAGPFNSAGHAEPTMTNGFTPAPVEPQTWPATHNPGPPAPAPAGYEAPRPQQPQPWAQPQDSAHPWVEQAAFGHAAPSGLLGRHTPAVTPEPQPTTDRQSAPQAGPVQPAALPQPAPREWPPAQAPGWGAHS